MKFADYFDSPNEFAGRGNVSELLFVPNDSEDLEQAQIAIICVPEFRYTESHGEINLEAIINQLSELNIHSSSPKMIALLGSLKLGATLEDTEAAIAEITEELILRRVVPVLINGNRDSNYGVYRAFQKLEEVVNIAGIDWGLNIDNGSNKGFIGRIIQEQPNYLFNYSSLGFQTYHVSPVELALADELYFDTMRLGELRGDIYKAEPIIRSSEIFAVSAESIKSSDFKSSVQPQPNGLYAEEVCQCFRYAGLSEKLKVVILSDVDLKSNASDSLLIAQLIWCLIDGLNARHSEIPNARNEQFLKYRVAIKDDEFQLVFYKSMKTDRWWMEVPVPPQYSNKYRKQHLIPCDYDDYKTATNDDLPNRWWRAYKKLL